MAKPTSFISERSAELILVPQLVQLLTPYYPRITPLYYMATREGSLNSRVDFKAAGFKILAMYARRPKVFHPGSGMITMKVNQQLFDHSTFLAEKGIATIIGIPLADTLEQINPDTPSRWFKLDNHGTESLLHIHKQAALVDKVLGITPIESAHIAESAQCGRTYNHWTQIIHLLKNGPRPYQWTRFFGYIYKPIYFILYI